MKILTGDSDQHKAYAFGEMTTRGIINGTDSYPIRTVRGWKYRLIWNLNHQARFTNACTSADYFESMVAAARAGDVTAQELVQKYQYRPEFELFDCDADPLEMNNLAADPQHAKVLERLKGKLQEWMAEQGDQGVETELDALQHLGRYKNMTREEAFDAWKGKKAGTGKGKKADKKKAG